MCFQLFISRRTVAGLFLYFLPHLLCLPKTNNTIIIDTMHKQKHDARLVKELKKEVMFVLRNSKQKWKNYTI